MTKKHYEAIAAGIRARLKAQIDNEDNSDEIIILLRRETVNCAKMFADVAKADNARFNRERFLVACGF